MVMSLWPRFLVHALDVLEKKHRTMSQLHQVCWTSLATQSECHMQPTMHVAHRCTAWLLPYTAAAARAVPGTDRRMDGWTDRHDTIFICLLRMPSVLWRCWLGGRKGIRPVKNWAVGYWRGYLSGGRCRLAYGPADVTATPYLLLH